MKTLIVGLTFALAVGACASEDPSAPADSRELPASAAPAADADVSGVLLAPAPTASAPSGVVWKTAPADQKMPERPKPYPPAPHW